MTGLGQLILILIDRIKDERKKQRSAKNNRR